MMIQVKVGDEVGYGRYHSWGTLLNHGFSKVTKINRWGHIILENGKVFDKQGQERNCQYGGAHIMDADRLRERLDEIKQARERANAANEIKKILDGQRTGGGEFVAISNEVREQMIALVNKL